MLFLPLSTQKSLQMENTVVQVSSTSKKPTANSDADSISSCAANVTPTTRIEAEIPHQGEKFPVDKLGLRVETPLRPEGERAGSQDAEMSGLGGEAPLTECVTPAMVCSTISGSPYSDTDVGGDGVLKTCDAGSCSRTLPWSGARSSSQVGSSTTQKRKRKRKKKGSNKRNSSMQGHIELSEKLFSEEILARDSETTLDQSPSEEASKAPFIGTEEKAATSAEDSHMGTQEMFCSETVDKEDKESVISDSCLSYVSPRRPVLPDLSCSGGGGSDDDRTSPVVGLQHEQARKERLPRRRKVSSSSSDTTGMESLDS